MISLREKAAIMRITEFEREQAERREVLHQRKKVAMEQIQQQIEEKKKEKEVQAEAVRAEGEAQKAKQLEYEKVQKAVAAAMKQQLLDILNANQAISDTRADNDIAKEQMEEKISRLERQKTAAQEEVQQTVATEDDEAEKKQNTARDAGDAAMADEDVVKVEASPESARTAGFGNAEMADGALDLKPDEKQLLDGRDRANTGAFLKVSGQSTLDGTKSIGTSN